MKDGELAGSGPKGYTLSVLELDIKEDGREIGMEKLSEG